jgi:hypothetical protein
MGGVRVTGAGRGRPPCYGQQYEIRVGGHLGRLICTAFPELQAVVRGGDTVLSGVLADQAALYGVLAQLEALGLELIEVRRLHRQDGIVPGWGASRPEQ